MHDLLGPVHERLIYLEQSTQDLHAELTALKLASQSIATRLAACEAEVVVKAPSAHVDMLVQGVVARLDAELKGFRAQIKEHPLMASGITGLTEAMGQDVGVAADCSNPYAATVTEAGSASDEDPPLQRPNLTLSLIVANRGAANLASGLRGEVTVEARSLERIAVVKQRAHEQLDVWYRFCALGDLDEGGVGHTRALPPLADCRLYAASSCGNGPLRQPLPDRHRVIECGLEDGAHLFLADSVTEAAAAEGHPVPQASSAEEGGKKDTGRGTSLAVLNLIVSYENSEVTLEARASESVGALKGRALAQLGVWRRFCLLSELAGSGEGAGAAELPLPENCQLHGPGGKSAAATALGPPLAESDRLIDCGLEDGAYLQLLTGARPRAAGLDTAT